LEEVTASIARNGICLKGILSTPDYSRTGELETLNMKLRKKLDLYAHVVHIKSLPGSSKHKNVDTIVIREQIEGEYSALEHQTVKVLSVQQFGQRLNFLVYREWWNVSKWSPAKTASGSPSSRLTTQRNTSDKKLPQFTRQT
jgi:isocitrate/isopropylmalate dehydrogenase